MMTRRTYIIAWLVVWLLLCGGGCSQARLLADRTNKPVIVLDRRSLSAPDIYSLRFAQVRLIDCSARDAIVALATEIARASAGAREFVFFFESYQSPQKFPSARSSRSPRDIETRLITISAANVSFEQVIGAICVQAGLRYERTPVGTAFTDRP